MNKQLPVNFELLDRLLWIDGDSSFDVKQLGKKFLTGEIKHTSDLYVNELTEEVKAFIQLTGKSLDIKRSVRELNTDWNIPEEYQAVSLNKVIFDKFAEKIRLDGIPESDMETYIERIVTEFEMFKTRNMLDVLKTVIYIVDTFEKNNIVWGTGRGSSCASYILYILGLHEVDSVKYELDIREFFK